MDIVSAVLPAADARRIASALIIGAPVTKSDTAHPGGALIRDGDAYTTSRYNAVRVRADEFPEDIYLSPDALRAIASIPADSGTVTLSYDPQLEEVTIDGDVYSTRHRNLPPVWELWKRFEPDLSGTFDLDGAHLAKILAWTNKHGVKKTNTAGASIRRSTPVQISAVTIGSTHVILVAAAGASFILQSV